MQKITPFLWFDHQAEEAMQFYLSIFKNSRVVRVSRYGDAGPGPKGSVMVAQFELDGQNFMALNGGPNFKFTPAISLSVDCKSQEEIDWFWKKLPEGGGTPGQCGWLQDKYGVSWQVVPSILGELVGDEDPARSNRVMQALMQMTRLDIAKLEAAAAGR
jgi:predicted 3-demethylubiquinone-9 3-methyltransferase (glyoxalase superfamily)